MKSSAKTAWCIALAGFFGAVALGLGAAVLSAMAINASEPSECSPSSSYMITS